MAPMAPMATVAAAVAAGGSVVFDFFAR